jgi:hypothetical protein
MIDILSFLPAKRKQSIAGWISFDAPCCELRGLTSKKTARGGLKLNSDDGWSYHCFNCGYTASYAPGRMLGFKSRQLLGWLGVDELTIERINLESLRHRSIHGLLEDSQRTIKKVVIEFEEKDLPPGLDPIEQGKLHDYLVQRRVSLDYPYMTNPELTRPNILIPFTYKGMMVGNATRFIDNRAPKFINDTQPGYVFGVDLQQSAWQYVIVTEGVFDALSINGAAVLHNDINTRQAEVIKSLERQVVVVPDQDEAGIKLVDRAVELGWAVSIPEWPAGVKDVNDAVIRLGKLGTLLTILAAKETSKIKIELRKKQLVKRLRA